MTSFIAFISALCQVFLSIAMSLGMVAGPANDAPIVFQDRENVNMSCVLLSDTHIRDTAFSPYYLDCAFEDIKNSEEKFDALVIAGDITEFSDLGSFELTWKSIDKADCFDHVLLASGNHDIRFLYEDCTAYLMQMQEKYLGTQIDKPYYSYDVNGYTFIIMGSDAWQFEKAVISDEQLAFIDSELARATKDGKPAFVVCHQPLAYTHGLPEVWPTGDLGEQSDELREILTKYENVFYINGHLHDGIYERSLEVLDEEKGVYSVNLPAFGKGNDEGKYNQTGLGAYMEVYDDEVVFTSRDFAHGKALDGYTRSFELK